MFYFQFLVFPSPIDSLGVHTNTCSVYAAPGANLLLLCSCSSMGLTRAHTVKVNVSSPFEVFVVLDTAIFLTGRETGAIQVDSNRLVIVPY